MARQCGASGSSDEEWAAGGLANPFGGDELQSAFARIAGEICIDALPQRRARERRVSPAAPGAGTPLEDVLAACRAPDGRLLPSSPLLRRVSPAEAVDPAAFPSALAPVARPSVAARLAALRSAAPRTPSHRACASAPSACVLPTPPPSAARKAARGAEWGGDAPHHAPSFYVPHCVALPGLGAPPRGHAPPGGDYVCKLCGVPGHWLKDCPLYEPRGPSLGRPPPAGRPPAPPPSYVCRLCGVPGHWIEQCARFQARPPPPEHAPDVPPPRGYVCNACRLPGHWIQHCAEARRHYLA